MNPNTIKELLECCAQKYGDKPCIKYCRDDKVICKSYSDIYADSISAARIILSKVPTRTHIAIAGKTSYSFLTFFNGIFASGNVAVPISPDIPETELTALLKKADVTAVVCDSTTYDKVCAAKKVIDIKIINISEVHTPNEALPLPYVAPDDCAMIMFTSGTTGEQKGVMLSSAAIISNVMFKEMTYEGNHVALNVLPMYHIFCFSCDYLKNLKDGVTICLNGDISNINKNLLLFEPSVLRLVPMHIEGLLKQAHIIRKKNPQFTDRDVAEAVFGKNLRSIIASGARLNSEIGNEFEKMGISIRQGYGMTETGPRIAVPNGKTNIRSAGAVIDICEIRISDGEIQVKSPSLFMGYYKDEASTKEVFTEDGWFMTGDIGYIEEDRQLYITGRKKNLIILSNGENISPEEIEKKIAKNDAVDEVLVFAENNSLVAEIYVSPEYLSSHSEAQTQEYISKYIYELNCNSISEKQIADIKFRTSPFEKTSSGKIKRKNNL